jgi:hypothetical protein
LKQHSQQGKDMSKKNEIATKPETLPAYLSGLGPTKTQDNFDSSDVVLPQIRLLQGVSSECTTFNDAKPGNFWHNGLDVDLGESIDFVVCSRKKKYLLQAPLDDGQGVLARADDFVTWDKMGSWQVKVDKKTTVEWCINDLNVEKSGLARWGTFDPSDENSPPAATLFYEYLVLLPAHLEYGPSIISLARSQIKQAKKGLNNKIALHGTMGRPMQSLVFKASSSIESNVSNQDFNSWNFTSNGFASKEVYETAREFGGSLQSYAVKDEGMQEITPTPAESAAF